MVYAAVMGHGVVGSGVVELMTKNASHIAQKAGEEIKVKYVLDIRDFPELPYANLFTKSFDDILADDEVSVVAEVIGGINPAYRFVKACLEAGKSVVTSNKEMVAAKGAELLAIAEKYNVNFLFEASVGGGIPIIRPLHQCLAANNIDLIAGILNGTTNYILTKMIKDGLSFDDALQKARELGYAEADPTADIEGHDACRKICILASLAFDEHVYPENVMTTGITKITLEDIAYAESTDCVIKLIGRTYRTNGKIFAMVSPAFIEKSSQLAGIDDVFNGVLVRGDATGDVVFYGKGAGKLPTASAVVGDIIDCVKASGTIKSLHWQDKGTDSSADCKAQSVVMYVRCTGKDSAAKAAECFGDILPLHRKHCPEDEFAFIAPELTEGAVEEKLAELAQKGIEVISAIRKLDY